MDQIHLAYQPLGIPQFLQMHYHTMELIASYPGPTKWHFPHDAFYQPPIPRAELTCLNHCQLYSQAITLADITTGDGTIIDPHYKTSIMDPHWQSKLTWLTQVHPPDKDKKIWTQALSFLKTASKLKQPLGAWIFKDYHQQHWWALEPDTNFTHHCINNAWTCYEPTFWGTHT